MNFEMMLEKIKSRGKIDISYSEGDRVEYCDVCLENRIEQFLKWYQDNMVRNGEDKKKKGRELNDFISDTAFWYRILYPDVILEEMINQFLFIPAHYQETYYQFCNCMTSGYLKEPRSCDRLMFDYGARRSYFYLNDDFVITNVDQMPYIPEDFGYNYDSFEGKSIFEVIAFLKEHHLCLEGVFEIEEQLLRYFKEKYMKEELLNCIMYRIIERDSRRWGAKRAMLFAKEFNRDIDVSMMYGISRGDPYLDEFIKIYFYMGGHSDLVCIDNYSFLSHPHQKVDFISMKKLIFLEDIQEEIMKYESSCDENCSLKSYQRSLQLTRDIH